MNTLLPPLLKCKSFQCNGMWQSNVIPLAKVRPMPKHDDFLGIQMLLFAKKTKKHIVFDAQIDVDLFYRTGIHSCQRTSSGEYMQTVCAGRLDLKDDFLEPYSGRHTSMLTLAFNENDACAACPVFLKGKMQDEFPIRTLIYRGYDKFPSCNVDVPMSYVFGDCGKSLVKFVKEQTHV